MSEENWTTGEGIAVSTVVLSVSAALILTAGSPDLIDKITGNSSLVLQQKRIEFLKKDFNESLSKIEKLQPGKETKFKANDKIYIVTRQP